MRFVNKLKYLYRNKRFIVAAEHRLKLIIFRCFRRLLAPSLLELNSIALSSCYSPDTLELSLFTKNTEMTWQMIISEYQLLSEKLMSRQAFSSSIYTYPPEFALEYNSCLLLYGVARIIKPAIVLECGVANGYSTFFLINALMRNGYGKLHSVDINTNVGSLLTESEKKDWVLKILDTKNPRSDFKNFIRSLKCIDLYLHDSDHRYTWQMFEYSQVLSKLDPAGIFISDDVDTSYAFIDICARNHLNPVFLIEKRKVLGMVQMSWTKWTVPL